MQSIEVFSVRDLRLRSSELVRDAEAGQVSIITKRGKPAVLALPFGSRLLNLASTRIWRWPCSSVDWLPWRRPRSLPVSRRTRSWIWLRTLAWWRSTTLPTS